MLPAGGSATFAWSWMMGISSKEKTIVITIIQASIEFIQSVTQASRHHATPLIPRHVLPALLTRAMPRL
jgi:hypothetical protein